MHQSLTMMKFSMMMMDTQTNQDWRYTEDRMKLRAGCLNILLNKYGGVRIEEAPYSTQDIYECVDTWISQVIKHPMVSVHISMHISLGVKNVRRIRLF